MSPLRKHLLWSFLWRLKDESKTHQEWSVFADVCRDIAKIQEINEQGEAAYKNLQEAKVVIQKHDIDSIYSSFAVRLLFLASDIW